MKTKTYIEPKNGQDSVEWHFLKPTSSVVSSQVVSIPSVWVVCRWCGETHDSDRCPRVKSIKYRKDGSIKRVKFHAGWEPKERPHVTWTRSYTIGDPPETPTTTSYP